MAEAYVEKELHCYHCGEQCTGNTIQFDEKMFCCEGCRMVYQLLEKKGLCDYYTLNNTPGLNQRVKVRPDKFAFLDDITIQQQLISFADDNSTHISFYLPQVHCSSCLYLLENLHRIDPAITSSRVDFGKKEISIIFRTGQVTIRRIAELLTSLGYEPYISLNNLNGYRPRIEKKLLYQLGVAGFCFANIMLLSFPEYLGIEESERSLLLSFRIISLVLSLPVVLFSAAPFYISGWKGLRAKFLNIDAPIALAILVTFGRSVYEIASGTGSGYLDSMSGIVFFMLAGRVLQDKTYRQLSFDRDFTSYFPIAVTVIKDGRQIPTPLPEVKNGDTLLIHNEELIPADGIITRGQAFIDYSFVTGESVPVRKEMGELVYAGGKQCGNNIELLVIKEVMQSYLTQLWARDEMKQEQETKSISFVHLLSRYFTYIVITISLFSGLYWAFNNESLAWNAATAVLIVACPCALLLSNTFTNASILRILGRNRFYLRNAQVIEDIANTTHVVFDKTGTLTVPQNSKLVYSGGILSSGELAAVAALTAHSNHPLSRAINTFIAAARIPAVSKFREHAGLGLEGIVDKRYLRLGSRMFIGQAASHAPVDGNVYLSIDGEYRGCFKLQNRYRSFTPNLLKLLAAKFRLSILSGDNDAERSRLRAFAERDINLHFEQKPEDKLKYIQRLQENNEKVMMVGDGLNDAGALKQSDTGIAVADDSNSFTPASDVIINAGELSKLPSIIGLCRANKRIIIASFIVSIVYNIIGIFFAVQGTLSPLVAAILMPSSSISILLLTSGSSHVLAKWYKL